jgi:hypothetical protein
MRSQLVHSANKRLANRFMLCRMTSAAAKRMTGTNGHFATSINQALEQIAVLPSDTSSLYKDDSAIAVAGPLDLAASVLP